MLARFLVYKAEVHVGGFANGWKGVGMLQNSLFAGLANMKLGCRKFYCHGFIFSNS